MSQATTAARGTFDPIPTIVASAAMFLISMDTLITNLALPTIQAELGGGMAAQQWVVDGYTLPLATLLLLAGNLSDRLGAKRVFVAGAVAFAASSLVCGFAGSIGMLVAGRVLLGVAAALLLPSSMSVISENYPDPRDQTRALAVWGIGGSTATAVGPLVGGLLVPIHWSLVFFINMPICLVVGVLALRLAHSPQHPTPVDLIGQLLAILGMACLVGGIIEGGSQGFAAPVPVALLVAGALGLIAFVWSQTRVRCPMMPLSLFGPLEMRLAVIAGFVTILNWNGIVFLDTLYLQQAQGLSPLAAGMAFVPAAVIGILGNIASDRITGTRGPHTTIRLGLVAMAAGFVVQLACCLAGTQTVVSVAVGVSVTGVGGALATPALAGLVLKSADPAQSGIASAVFNTLRQVGGAIGIAVFGAFTALAPSFGLGLAMSFTVSLVLVAGLFAFAARVGALVRAA